MATTHYDPELETLGNLVELIDKAQELVGELSDDTDSHARVLRYLVDRYGEWVWEAVS